MELRCGKRLHAILADGGILEISCRSALCGHKDGTVVIHRFNLATGELINTKYFKDPSIMKGTDNG